MEDHEKMMVQAMADAQPKPTFLPLMKRPSRSVEKESAEKEMRDLLERTRLMLRGG